MSEPAITAEDLTLYALHALEGNDVATVDLLLRSSSEARTELSFIRGDLAALALSAQQHTPPALSRQRLLKQVARERRAVPIHIVMGKEQPFALDNAATGRSAMQTVPHADTAAVDSSSAYLQGSREAPMTAEQRRARVHLPRIVSEPEPMVEADLPQEEASVSDEANLADEISRFRPSTAMRSDLPAVQESSANPDVARRKDTTKDTTNGRSGELQEIRDPSISPRVLPPRSGERMAAARSAAFPVITSVTPPVSAEDEPQDRYVPSQITSVHDEDPVPRRSRGAVVMAWTGWVAAAGLAASTIVAVRSNGVLRDRLRTQQADLVATRASAVRSDLVLQTLESAASQRFLLARQDTAPVPTARVAYLPEHGSLVFQGTNLEPLPAYKTYELWLIPKGEGLLPVPAGTFKPDGRGYATLVLPSLPKGTVAGNFGVTIEDEAGSIAPTLPILLIGQTG